jgi:hypothetical protein
MVRGLSLFSVLILASLFTCSQWPAATGLEIAEPWSSTWARELDSIVTNFRATVQENQHELAAAKAVAQVEMGIRPVTPPSC